MPSLNPTLQRRKSRVWSLHIRVYAGRVTRLCSGEENRKKIEDLHIAARRDRNLSTKTSPTSTSNHKGETTRTERGRTENLDFRNCKRDFQNAIYMSKKAMWEQLRQNVNNTPRSLGYKTVMGKLLIRNGLQM